MAEKHTSFREDPVYTRIEKKWGAALRRRQRAEGAYLRPTFVTLALLRERRSALRQAERAVRTWQTQLDRRREYLIRRWRAEGTL